MKKALLSNLFLTLVFGLFYPLIIFLCAQLFFSHKANGSLVYEKKKVQGSSLLCQRMEQSVYFHCRPILESSLAPTSQALYIRSKKLAEEYRQKNELSPDTKIPSDAIFSSASNVDPHISIENALLQAKRVAKHRNIPLQKVEKALDLFCEKPLLYCIGRKRVNVFLVNLYLDKAEEQK